VVQLASVRKTPVSDPNGGRKYNKIGQYGKRLLFVARHTERALT